MDYQLKTVDVTQLKPLPENPRVHPESMMAKLERSITEFGFTNPIIALPDGTILAGHARLKAAERLGLKKVPVIFIDLPREKALAYCIADNKIAEESDWDTQKLKDLLEELDTGSIDIELTGFTEAEIEDLMTQIHTQKKTDPDEFDADTAAEAIVEPVTKRGMIYSLGRHRLMCGDATSFEDVKKLMGGAWRIWCSLTLPITWLIKTARARALKMTAYHRNNSGNCWSEPLLIMRWLQTTGPPSMSAMHPGSTFPLSRP